MRSGGGRWGKRIEVGETFAQILVGAKEERFDGGDGTIHDARHLRIVQLLILVHQDGGAVIRREFLYGGAHFGEARILQQVLFHIRHAGLGLAQSGLCGRMVEALMTEFVAVVAEPIERQVGGDAKEPGAETGGGPVIACTVDPKEDFLGEFFGDGRIAHQAVDVSDHGTAVFLHDAAEAGAVTGLEGQHPRNILFQGKTRLSRHTLCRLIGLRGSESSLFRMVHFCHPYRMRIIGIQVTGGVTWSHGQETR